MPTLGRAGSARLQRLDPSAFYLIVVDEAHHAVAESYKRVLQHFRVFEEGSPRLLVGFTATPKRGDGKALGEIFRYIAFTRGLEEMIRQRYLSSIVGWRVRTEVGLDNVKIVGGDFSESQLARAVNTTERNEIVLKAYWKKARDRQCIVFCVDVQHSKDIADRFSRSGIRTATVWGDMPCDERKDALKKFASGKIKVLTNCNVLTEGFDEPSVSCVLLARPTKSLLLYAQMVGRGTRLHPGKTDVCVIDIVDNSEAHTLADLNRLFELPDSMDLRGHNVLKTLQRVREIGHRYPWVDVNGVSKAGCRVKKYIPASAGFGALRSRVGYNRGLQTMDHDQAPRCYGLPKGEWQHFSGIEY